MRKKLRLKLEIDYFVDDKWYKDFDSEISDKEMCKIDEYNFKNDMGSLFSFLEDELDEHTKIEVTSI